MSKLFAIILSAGVVFCLLAILWDVLDLRGIKLDGINLFPNMSSVNESIETDLHVQIGELSAKVVTQASEIEFLRGELAKVSVSPLEAGTQIPKNYYTNSAKNGTANDLKTYLNEKFVMPANYNIGVFDCSEQAAFMEHELENAGFDTIIVTGDSPTGEATKHAWIIVNTADNFRVAIEPTAISSGMDAYTQSMMSTFNQGGRGIIYSKNNSNYYDGYTDSFEDIESIVNKNGIDDYDWWLGMWNLK